MENSKGELIGSYASVVVADFYEPCPVPLAGDVRVDVCHTKDGVDHELDELARGDRRVRPGGRGADA